MNDIIDSCRIEGLIQFEGHDVYDPKYSAVQLRTKVGMVFQSQTHFPWVFTITSHMVPVVKA